MRVYLAVPASLPAFHRFFREYLLPVQLLPELFTSMEETFMTSAAG